MDAFAVSIVKGISLGRDKLRPAILLASLIGGFQALMPVIGWSAGLGLKDLITGFDHWVAFVLLGFIGTKMIYDSMRGDDRKEEDITFVAALALAVATSIDALMVGLSFAFLDTPILVPILIIGIVTFVLSFVAVIFGSAIGSVIGKKTKALGGVILILIGLRILAEHLL